MTPIWIKWKWTMLRISESCFARSLQYVNDNELGTGGAPDVLSTGEIFFQVTQPVNLSVCNSVFAITAIVGNSLILIALPKDTTLHPPSKVLLRSLATSDLFIGMLQPLYVT